MKQFGLMQGRLVEPSPGVIQEFPVNSWQLEFRLAKDLGLNLLEWTVDDCGFYENPINSKDGGEKINRLKSEFDISIHSVTGDNFMQRPIWTVTCAKEQYEYQRRFSTLLQGAKTIGVRNIVFPLVDKSSLKSGGCLDTLSQFMSLQVPSLKNLGIVICFEVDLAPREVLTFLSNFDSACFGVNYDLGNSAALGFTVSDEFNAYGDRIRNIHIKDKDKTGTTVRLGKGLADFKSLFHNVSKKNYEQPMILQTARAKDGDHVGEIEKNLNFLRRFVNG